MLRAYVNLPQQDRRAAEKLAKKLLRTTPAAPQREFSGTVRDALDTGFIKAENVVAALVYEQGDGTWWSDVVFQRGKYKVAHGVQCSSKQQALSCLETQIADVKATREHPLVADFRSVGVEFEAFLWLGVRHKEFGYKYVQCPIDELSIKDLQFRRRHRIFDSMGKAGRRHAAKIARETVLRYARDFGSDDVFLEPPDGTDKSEDEIKSWREAASFLLGRGFSDIDDRDDETDVIAECYLRIPDEVANVSSVSGVEKPRDSLLN
jgi:hypothetical protein